MEGLIFGILRYLLQTARGGHSCPRDFFLCPKKTGACYSAYRFSQVRSSMSSLERSERIS